MKMNKLEELMATTSKICYNVSTKTIQYLNNLASILVDPIVTHLLPIQLSIQDFLELCPRLILVLNHLTFFIVLLIYPY